MKNPFRVLLIAVLSVVILARSTLPAGAIQAVQIQSVIWDSENHFIHIGLTPWPATWPGWTMYVDGVATSMDGSAGQVVVRPNAPLIQPPTGLVVGTLPWVTGLDQVEFPCCGAIQFDIPGEGLTNRYAYNLHDSGCFTASTKNCPSDWTVHEGDLIISGSETRVIENMKFSQKGNIYIQDNATLIIRNSDLMMSRGATPTIHVYFFVDPGATLIIDNSRIYPSTGLVCVINRGSVQMTDSPTQIHYFDMSEGAQLSMTRSEMINPIGGLLQVSGGTTSLTDSTIGALGLNVPAGAHLNISGLKSGAYFNSWEVHQWIPEADYTLTLTRSTVLKDDLSGDLLHGPYERGWIFFLNPESHVRLAESELRKVFLDIKDDTVSFHDLKIGVPSSLAYRDIILTNVVVNGQWPFTIDNSAVTITNSNYLFLQPGGTSTVRLINSHIVEFIPRDFLGTMIFENGRWSTAGEIIGNVPYHSMKNDFMIKGSLRTEGLRENLQWKDATVTREYEVIVINAFGSPAEGVKLEIDGQTALTDAQGKATFNLVFDEDTYKIPHAMYVWKSGRLNSVQGIDFFSATPYQFTLNKYLFLPVIRR